MDALETHAQLFGKNSPISEKQRAFYSNGSAKGISTKEMDPEVADAVIIRALAQVREDGNKEFLKVYLLFPEDQRAWVIQRIHNLATTTLTRLQPILKTPKGHAAIAAVRRWLEALQIGPVESWPKDTPPERWAALGYTKEDNVPNWLKEALV